MRGNWAAASRSVVQTKTIGKEGGRNEGMYRCLKAGICMGLKHCGRAKEFEGTEKPEGFRASVLSCWP
jgi:hypothetical protein